MPINESLGRPSNLTPQQQRDAMRAVYGLGEHNMTPPADLTYEERIKMRRYLDNLDQKETGGSKVFDLNKPPVAPYVFREYPILMYNHDTQKTRAAHNYPEREQMREAGWTEDPSPPPEVPEVELTAEERAEASVIDAQLKKRKK